LGAPQNILFPVMAVVIAILFPAIFAWMVGHFRTTRSLNRLEGPNRPHAPARAYVLPWLVAIGGGIAYAGASDVVQRWLWAGFFVAGIVVFIWLQRRERARSSGRHHR
jgi:bacteriorhodopsin